MGVREGAFVDGRKRAGASCLELELELVKALAPPAHSLTFTCSSPLGTAPNNRNGMNHQLCPVSAPYLKSARPGAKVPLHLAPSFHT